MGRKTKQINANGMAGNAMIYVLIVIALFAALAFVLARQHDTGGTSQIGNETVNVDASQILQVSNQVKQGVDQMIYSGSHIDELDFCQPSDSCFATGAATHKVFHPAGGGISLPVLPSDAIHQVDANPAPGWYMGAFSNVEWTETPASDVIFVAHQISQPVCAKINEMITGSTTIPPVGASLARVLVDAGKHSAGTNIDLDKTICPGCDGHPSLCVSDAGGTMFSFYNILEQR